MLCASCFPRISKSAHFDLFRYLRQIHSRCNSSYCWSRRHVNLAPDSPLVGVVGTRGCINYSFSLRSGFTCHRGFIIGLRARINDKGGGGKSGVTFRYILKPLESKKNLFWLILYVYDTCFTIIYHDLALKILHES